ncbi:Monooxygenase, partial [Lachnellula willkommii]
GVSAITLTLTNLSTHTPLTRLLGRGTFWACAPRRTLIAQHGSLDTARIYLMLASPSETYLQDNALTGLTGPELARKLLEPPKANAELEPEPEPEPGLEFFQNFSKDVRDLITAACLSNAGAGTDIVDAKPLYMLPPTDNKWTHTPGLTLIGDAAHLMTPFAGEGVNCAMLDALELSKAIISSHGGDLDKGIEGFEKKMWRRNRAIAEDTYGNLKLIFHDERAPEGIVRDFESHGGVVELMGMGFGFLKGKVSEFLGYD